MSKRKSDYAIIVSCNVGYGFGLISTLNAQRYFKTDADWEIAYEDFPEDYREKVSALHTTNVTWTHISELTPEVNDRRSDKNEPLNRFWLAYWLLARKVLREGKYKAVCVIQADQFVFVNLDVYFRMAEAGIHVASEYPFTTINAEDLPFGNDKLIWDRGQCGIFDSVNFMGQQHVDMISDIIDFQCEDPFKGEASHSVIALNRAACKHGSREKTLRLDGQLWVCDNMWGGYKLHLGAGNDRVFNDRMIQINAWHCRWWQPGRAEAELERCNKNALNTLEHNFNLTRTFMERFNNMLPEIRSEVYVKECLSKG